MFLTWCVVVCVSQSLMSQIIVAGGATLVNGFTERLEGELNGVFQPHTRFKILGSGLGQKWVYFPDMRFPATLCCVAMFCIFVHCR